MNFSGNTRRNNNKMPARSGGPLMTDHLQDLELELELLKRKRQLIQQQQSEMLYNRRPAVDMGFNQPSQSYNVGFNEPQQLNFSQLYNEAPRPGPGPVKRRAEPDWSNAPSGHFNNPMGGNKRPRQSGPINRFMDQNNQNNTQTFQRPRPNQPQPLLGQPKPLLVPPKPLMGQPKPLMNFQSRPMRRAPQPMMKQNQGPKPLTHHPNFKRNKQSGPFPHPGFTPNNTNTPLKKTSPVKPLNSTSPKKAKKATVLSADQEPSNKTNGRLELALGMIVKEIKLTYGKNPEYAGIFASMPLARTVKKVIRERVRSVMTGKVVGLVPDVVAEYRKKYPLETDKEIMDLALAEKQKNDQKSDLTIKLLEEGDPELFFKKNMNRIIEASFAELMRKVEQVSNKDGSNPSTEEILEKLPEIKKAPEGDEEGSAEDSETPTDASAKEKYYRKWIIYYLNRKLTTLLVRNTKAIFKAFDADDMYLSTKAAIIINTNKKAQAMNTNKAFNNTTEQANDPEMPRNLPYFAKVLAQPSIPKRRLMQDFLEQFHPRTIKRHKKNYNLLFVGFKDKEDYDRILAADQTVIGNATLNITGNVVKTTTTEIEDQNDLELLTPQLDDQINDLLSSIRKADEESKANGNTNNTNAEVDLTAVSSEKVEELTDSQSDEKLEETNENKEAEANDAEDAQTVTAEATNESETIGGSGDAQDDNNDDECQVIETNGKEVVTIEDDEVPPLQSDEEKAAKPPGTPAKGRAPATPSTIRTRRSSRLVQN